MFTKKRHDGTYIKNLHYFTRIMPYFMPTRTKAAFYFEQEFDVTGTLEYVNKRMAEPNLPKITIFFTNAGSAGINAPSHHNYEPGNCGIYCARAVNMVRDLDETPMTHK